MDLAILPPYSRYQGKAALALLFVGIEHGTPQKTYFVWQTENGGISRLPIHRLGANSFNGIGSFDAIVSYVTRTPKWRSMSPIVRITKALQIPNDVGPPFSILRITPNSRVEWIKRGTCDAGQQRYPGHETDPRSVDFPQPQRQHVF